MEAQSCGVKYLSAPSQPTENRVTQEHNASKIQEINALLIFAILATQSTQQRTYNAEQAGFHSYPFVCLSKFISLAAYSGQFQH